MKQIRLSNGLFALVNDEDFEFLNQWKWSATQSSRRTKWYAVRHQTIDGAKTKFRMHVEVLKRQGVVIPVGHVVDHFNHNSLDNRFYLEDTGEIQLEAITQVENMKRSPGWKKKGVVHGPHRKKTSTRNIPKSKGRGK